jgi:SAM-dependent methyltransferase
VFVYHHGFKTGERVHGLASQTNGWNSFEKYHRTNTALIKKHGLKVWWDTMKGSYELPHVEYAKSWEDAEGDVIRSLITDSDKAILDLGCGGNKTLDRAVGVDFVPKGERIPTLEGDPISEADLVADVSKELPVEDGSQDIVIARHILEHMQDPIQVLAIWIKKLKKNGRLILALPNQEWHATIPMNHEHLISFSPSSAMTMLSLFDLKIAVYNAENSISFIIEGRRA